MSLLKRQDIVQYVVKNISNFHEKRIQSISELSLKKVLQRKNPYLFKAKNVLTAAEIVKSIADAHVSSNEETIFGDFLEQLAIFICGRIYGGQKSGISGIDLEFEKDKTRYLIVIKSGPNWGNSQAVLRMVSNFNSARKVLKTSGSRLNVIAVNGCCYGRENNPYKSRGDYYKYCGQMFWEFISGNVNLYIDIIEPLGYKAREKNQEFLETYGQMLNRLTIQFGEEFCFPDGKINWNKILEMNSGLSKTKSHGIISKK